VSEDDPSLVYNGILITDNAALGHGSMAAMRRLVPRPPKRAPTFQAIIGDLDPEDDAEPGEIHVSNFTMVKKKKRIEQKKYQQQKRKKREQERPGKESKRSCYFLIQPTDFLHAG
jgi:hypothetical protein